MDATAKGLVEVWASGVFTVRATGSIGHDDVAGPTQYFKFGIYRNAMPGTAIAYLDSFRRGVGRTDVGC